jgi:hypothetical protein
MQATDPGCRAKRDDYSIRSPEPELFFFLFFIYLYHIRRIRGFDARIYIYRCILAFVSNHLQYPSMAPHLNTRTARGGIQRSPARSPARSLAPADDPVALARVCQIEQQMKFKAEDREARGTRKDAESAARIAAMAPQSAPIPPHRPKTT